MLVATAPPPPPPPPARVLAFAREFAFSLSRARVAAGAVRLQMENLGEDDHDLVLVGPRGGVRAGTGRVAPGDLGELAARLAPGRYRVVCTVADHAARGMTASIVVRPRAGGRRR